MQIKMYSKVDILTDEDFNRNLSNLETYMKQMQEKEIKVIGIYNTENTGLTEQEIEEYSKKDSIKPLLEKTKQIKNPYLVVELNTLEDLRKIVEAIKYPIGIYKLADGSFEIVVLDYWED